MNLFLTGTDTGVGKTFVATLLVSALRRAGFDTVPMKPLCAGDREDALALHRACEGALPLNTINPVWHRAPAAPYSAALIENRPADLALVRDTWQQLRERYRSIIVEGVGGWRVPIAPGVFVSDLAVEFGLPVAVVIRNRLGALNHALLTVEAVKQSGLPYAGAIFNEAEPPADPATATNRAVLEELLGEPFLFVIEPGQQRLELGVA